MLPEDNSSVRIARQFVKTLHPEVRVDERIELRYKKPGDSGTMSRTFVPDAEQAAELAVSYATTYDVYVGVATRSGEDGTKAGVCRTRALWADLDAKDGHTRQSRLKQLLDLPCHPSMLVWTGGGWHAYWLLVRPAEIPEELDYTELVMRRIAVGLDSDPVHDRSRIMRVPGTFNYKYGEWHPVKLELYEPERRYEFDQLQEMAESLPDAPNDNGAGKTPRKVLAEPDPGGQQKHGACQRCRFPPRPRPRRRNYRRCVGRGQQAEMYAPARRRGGYRHRTVHEAVPSW